MFQRIRLLIAEAVLNNVAMSKSGILDELPKLTKIERQEIRLRLAGLDGEDWLDDEDPLTVHEKAVLETRLAACATDPEAGCTWEEIESRIRSALLAQQRGVSTSASKNRK